jgi:hypothetical protein
VKPPTSEELAQALKQIEEHGVAFPGYEGFGKGTGAIVFDKAMTALFDIVMRLPSKERAVSGALIYGINLGMRIGEKRAEPPHDPGFHGVREGGYGGEA